jgi:hypothetical protein
MREVVLDLGLVFHSCPVGMRRGLMIDRLFQQTTGVGDEAESYC